MLYASISLAWVLSIAALRIGLGSRLNSEIELADMVISKLKDMNETFGVPKKAPNLKADDFSLIAKQAYAEALEFYAGPRYMGKKDIEVLLGKLL